MKIASAALIGELPHSGTGATAASDKPSEIECQVIRLYDQYRDPVLRYVLSFGICVDDAEEVTQDVFLALFRHLRLGRGRQNLHGWIFRVAHNLALKLRLANNEWRHAKLADAGWRSGATDQEEVPLRRLPSDLKIIVSVLV